MQTGLFNDRFRTAQASDPMASAPFGSHGERGSRAYNGV